MKWKWKWKFFEPTRTTARKPFSDLMRIKKETQQLHSILDCQLAYLSLHLHLIFLMLKTLTENAFSII